MTLSRWACCLAAALLLAWGGGPVGAADGPPAANGETGDTSLGIVSPALPEPLSLSADVAAPGSPVTSADAAGPSLGDGAVREPDTASLPDPATTGTVAAITLPDLPPAPVVVMEADGLAGAIELRLADPKNLWLPRTPKTDRPAVASFFGERRNRGVWVADGGWSPRALDLIDRIRHADEDGLDPADYPVPVLGLGSRPDSYAELAEADLKLSIAAALYARDARGGRIDPTRLSPLITPKLDLPAADAVLAGLAAAPSPGHALGAFNPRYPGYLALRDKLAAVRAGRPSGPPMARASRRGELTTQAIATLDDGAPRGLSPGNSARLEGDLIANMERWRWLPAELAPKYVAVNIPEFRLRIFDGRQVVHETRVITGKPDSPTPVFSGLLEYAVVNPSWYLPPSILKKEFLPHLAQDPSYAARLGYDVVRHGSSISVRQPPGERNALGFVKFMFPNQHAVYLHDTPNRTLFSSARRAFSHGCVRVEQPFQLADFLLGPSWSEERLRHLIGRGERTIRMPEKIPVHLTYFTQSVDDYGELRSFEDLYGYNRRVRMALGLGA